MFRIDTGVVLSASSDINRVQRKINNVEKSVSGYDVSAIEIDLGQRNNVDIAGLFTAARQKIVNNLSVACCRVDVTSKQLVQISKAHEDLQNMLGEGELNGISSDGDKILTPALATVPDVTTDPGSDDTPSSDSPTSDVPSSDDTDQTDDIPDTGDTQEPEYQSDAEIEYGSTPSPYVVVTKLDSGAKKGKTGTTPSKFDEVIKKKEDSNTDNDKSDNNSTKSEDSEKDNNTSNVDSGDDEFVSLPIPSTVGSIIVPTVSDTSVGEVLSNSSITYDETGYAKLGDRFIISCSEKYGKIGDIIQIKDKNGEIHECIIGNVTKTDGFNMYVNNQYTFSSDNIDSRLNGNFDSIRNLTNIQSKSNVIEDPTPITNSETAVDASSNGSDVTNYIDPNKQQSSSSNVEAVNELYEIDSESTIAGEESNYPDNLSVD